MSQASSILSMATEGAGATMSAVSSMVGGDEARRIAGYNKTALREAAHDTLQRGADAADEHREKVRRIISRQNAAFSAGGVDSGSGSALDVQAETAGMGELDALRIMNNAQRQSDYLNDQAEFQKYQGREAWLASRAGAAGALMSSGKATMQTLGNMVDRVYKYNNTGGEPPSFTSSDASTLALTFKSEDLTKGSGYRGYSLLE